MSLLPSSATVAASAFIQSSLSTTTWMSAEMERGGQAGLRRSENRADPFIDPRSYVFFWRRHQHVLPRPGCRRRSEFQGRVGPALAVHEMDGPPSRTMDGRCCVAARCGTPRYSGDRAAMLDRTGWDGTDGLTVRPGLRTGCDSAWCDTGDDGPPARRKAGRKGRTRSITIIHNHTQLGRK